MRTRALASGSVRATAKRIRQYVENFALYNAPPGTWQRMAVYFLASADAAEPTRESVLAFTRGDRFKPIPGYKTMVNHFHLRFTERQRASGGFDNTFQDVVAMKALGINIVGLSDFHGDLRGNDTGLGRFTDQKDYGTASAKASDKDFLVTPWEEPSAYFGGHYNILFPKNVYWTKRRDAGQPFTENLTGFGKVYHTGSTADVQQMLDAEDGYWFHAHPRTKGTTGYPDAIFDKPWVRNDRYLGVAFKPGMGQDNSEARMCEFRCFDATDTMNNLIANSGLRPKYIIADVDTYKKSPEDDLYPGHPVNYVKLDRVPGPTEDWRPILNALRNGDFWVVDRRNPDHQLRRRGHRQRAHDRREPGVDVPARIRRGRVGRRQEDRSSDHPRHRSGGLRDQEVCDPVQRYRQGVGAVCRLGLGRQRRLRAARLAESEDDDDSAVTDGCNPVTVEGPAFRLAFAAG